MEEKEEGVRFYPVEVYKKERSAIITDNRVKESRLSSDVILAP